MPAKKANYTLVSSESGDWYVIPANKSDEWFEKWDIAENPPKWAVYVQDPGHVEFTNWRSTL